MLNRFNQLGLALALVSFATMGTAYAQDEDMGDDSGEEWSEGDGEDKADDGDMTDDGGDEGEGGGEDKADDGGDGGEAHGGHGFVVPKGKIQINASIGINMTSELTADPIVIAPDVIYGVMPKLDVGLYHSNYGLTGFWNQGFAPSGVCLAGDACGEFYNGPTGILGRYELATGQMSMRANGGLVLTNILDDADMHMSLKAGVDIMYALNDKMFITANPFVAIGLNDRDFNGDDLAIPVAFMYGINEQIMAGLQSGINGPLDGFGDFFLIPLNIAGMYKVDEKLMVGAAFGMPAFAGSDASSTDIRDVNLFVGYNL